MYAAWLGVAEAVDCLLRAGAKPNLEAPDGTTALMLATTAGHLSVVKCMLSHANVLINKKDKKGNTALMLASFWVLHRTVYFKIVSFML